MSLDTDWKTNEVKINTITIITLINIIKSIVINNAYDLSYNLLIYLIHSLLIYINKQHLQEKIILLKVLFRKRCKNLEWFIF